MIKNFCSFAFTPTSTIQIPLFTLLNKPLRVCIVCATAFWTSSGSFGFSQPLEIHQLQNPWGPKHSVPTPLSGNIKNHSGFGRGEVSQPMVRAFGKKKEMLLCRSYFLAELRVYHSAIAAPRMLWQVLPASSTMTVKNGSGLGPSSMTKTRCAGRKRKTI